jgi:hypothetical protein
MKKLSLCLAASVVCSLAHAAPSIQFETNFYDFGHLVAVEYANGVFKFKNVGDEVLKLDPPHPSCGCTDAKAPETVAPGQSGEVTYRIVLDHRMTTNQKAITIVSNDPKSPSTTLKMQLDFDPVYEIGTKTVTVTVPVDKEEASESFTINRPDGKALDVDKIVCAPEWITAAVEAAPDDANGQVKVTVKRGTKAPPRFSGTVKLYNTKLTKDCFRTITVYCEIQGELAASPRGLYWMFADKGDDLKSYPTNTLVKSVQIKSVLGHEVQIKKATSSIKGTSVEVVPKEPGKIYDVVLKLDEIPHAFVNGKVTLETTLESLPVVELPVTINVYKQ